jgi:hypothetical protein
VPDRHRGKAAGHSQSEPAQPNLSGCRTEVSEQSHLHALTVASCVSRSLASLLLLLSNSHVHTAALRSQAQAVASFEGLQQTPLSSWCCWPTAPHPHVAHFFRNCTVLSPHFSQGDAEKETWQDNKSPAGLRGISRHAALSGAAHSSNQTVALLAHTVSVASARSYCSWSESLKAGGGL